MNHISGISHFIILFLAVSVLRFQESLGFVGTKYVSLDVNTVIRRHHCDTSIPSLKSSMTTIIDKRSNNDNGTKKGLKAPSILLNTVGIFVVGWGMKIFTRRWLAIKAGEKFFRAGLSS